MSKLEILAGLLRESLKRDGADPNGGTRFDAWLYAAVFAFWIWMMLP